VIVNFCIVTKSVGKNLIRKILDEYKNVKNINICLNSKKPLD